MLGSPSPDLLMGLFCQWNQGFVSHFREKRILPYILISPSRSDLFCFGFSEEIDAIAYPCCLACKVKGHAGSMIADHPAEDSSVFLSIQIMWSLPPPSTLIPLSCSSSWPVVFPHSGWPYVFFVTGTPPVPEASGTVTPWSRTQVAVNTAVKVSPRGVLMLLGAITVCATAGALAVKKLWYTKQWSCTIVGVQSNLTSSVFLSVRILRSSDLVPLLCFLSWPHSLCGFFFVTVTTLNHRPVQRVHLHYGRISQEHWFDDNALFSRCFDLLALCAHCVLETWCGHFVV